MEFGSIFKSVYIDKSTAAYARGMDSSADGVGE
jgi:hypothetical protein